MRKEVKIDGTKVKVICLQEGKTLKAFADQAGYSYGWIIKIVNNKPGCHNPDLVHRLAQYLGVTLEQITLSA